MRNRWYVIGLLVPTVLLAWWTIHLAMGDSGFIFVVPGALAAGLAVAAYRVSRAASFAPAARSNWNTGQTVGMTRWLKHRSDDAGADAARTAVPSNSAKPSKHS